MHKLATSLFDTQLDFINFIHVDFVTIDTMLYFFIIFIDPPNGSTLFHLTGSSKAPKKKQHNSNKGNKDECKQAI